MAMIKATGKPGNVVSFPGTHEEGSNWPVSENILTGRHRIEKVEGSIDLMSQKEGPSR
jgi:hypothetical protein